MTLDIRPTGDPNHFDLYEDEEKIGEITNPPDVEDGIAYEADRQWWLEIWTQMGTGKTWEANHESFEQVKQYAHELYEEFVAERRELSKGSRIWTTGSIPMGGKPGWRRR
ncbi:hypothetical protein [Streptomyces mirabilis]|uniref:hypothetical protein n=1 Tax=Streptomyces mirabilis TaxID=68239 RepID=UPI0036760E5E